MRCYKGPLERRCVVKLDLQQKNTLFRTTFRFTWRLVSCNVLVCTAMFRFAQCFVSLDNVSFGPTIRFDRFVSFNVLFRPAGCFVSLAIYVSFRSTIRFVQCFAIRFVQCFFSPDNLFRSMFCFARRLVSFRWSTMFRFAQRFAQCFVSPNVLFSSMYN